MLRTQPPRSVKAHPDAASGGAVVALAGRLWWWALLALGIWGILQAFVPSTAPNIDLLDAVFLVGGGLVAMQRVLRGLLPQRMAFIALVGLLLLVARFLIVLLGDTAPLTDALQAHKWLIFVIVLAFLPGSRIAQHKRFADLTKILLVLALIKYLIVGLQSSFHLRAGLMTENNYELALFCGLLMVSWGEMGRRRIGYLAVLGVVVALSASRSGVVAFAVTLAYLLWVSRWHNKIAKSYVALITLLIAALGVAVVFSDRLGPDGRIDRLNFLEVFWHETSAWGPLQWAFGAEPVTTLSSSGCSRLSFYSALLSSEGDGSCYSVILHLFVLRAIFDFGIVGLVLSFVAIGLILRQARVSPKLIAALLAVAVTNSLSVSGINNLFVIMPIALAVLLSREPELTSSLPEQPEMTRVKTPHR